MHARSLLGWARIALAASLVGVYLASTAPAALRVALFMLRLPARAAHESLPAARARLFGEGYSSAVDAIRRQLPLDRPYALATAAVESPPPGGGGANGSAVPNAAGGAAGVDDAGAGFWVRYDLAPRRAVFIGRLDQLRDAPALRRELDADLQQVVVAAPGLPPRLYDRESFLQDIARRGGAAGPAPAAPRSGH
jgi:hypothetical protein